MSNQPPTPDDLQRDDDAGIELLLREVGARDEPSREMADAIRSAVHAEWQAVVEARQRRKRFISYGLAASILGIAATALIAWRIVKVESTIVTIARMEGPVEIVAVNGHAQPISVGQQIAVGDVLRTGQASRVAVDFGNGVEARMDSDSAIAFQSKQRVALLQGALYVDADPQEHAQDLSVDTPFGAVRHIGTQYQVRLVRDGIEVGVREGRVEITSPHGSNSGAAGEQLHLSANGSVIRNALAPHDASWQWAAAIMPAFSIEDRTLEDFLTWAARESGKKLTFNSPRAQQTAATVRLRGSIEGLSLETALVAVLSTTQLHRIKTNDESIHIGLTAPVESNGLQRPTP